MLELELELERGNLRSSILGFAAGLRRCHIIIVVAIASPPIGIIIHVPSIAHLVCVVDAIAD